MPMKYLLTTILLAVLSAWIYHVASEPSTYEECVLNNVAAAQTDVAAHLVRNTCRTKFPEATIKRVSAFPKLEQGVASNIVCINSNKTPFVLRVDPKSKIFTNHDAKNPIPSNGFSMTKDKIYTSYAISHSQLDEAKGVDTMHWTLDMFLGTLEMVQTKGGKVDGGPSIFNCSEEK